MIPYGKQTIDQDDIDAVVEVLKSDWLTQGPKVEEFEKALAAHAGAAYAVVMNNGTAALQAAYYAAGLEAGDEVISTPLTFAATTNAALWFGAKARFADILPETGNLDIATVESLINDKTRVLAPVDFAGHPVDLDPLIALARRKGLTVIEDGCHALGARHKGRPVGSISDMTVFSFHPVKSITTGEGGAVLTSDKKFYERLVRFRGHGIVKEGFVHQSPGPWYHEMQTLGMNFRLTDIQCALGLSQLRKLPAFLKRRREIAARYQQAFKGVRGIRQLMPLAGDESAWHLFVLVLEGELGRKRDDVFKELRRRNVGVQLHYIPVHRHPYYEKLGYSRDLCPRASDLSNRAISLPIYPALSENDQERVIELVRDIVTAAHEDSVHS